MQVTADLYRQYTVVSSIIKTINVVTLFFVNIDIIRDENND